MPIHFVKDGDSEGDVGVVMLHAGPNSGRQWRKIAPHFPEYHVIATDVLGFGETGPGQARAY